jgi:hypothetical protein
MVSHDHHHHHSHSHGPAAHPPQGATWSILRMPVVTRLTAALAVCAALWAAVLLAMR